MCEEEVSRGNEGCLEGTEGDGVCMCVCVSVLVCMKCVNGKAHTASVRDFHDTQASPRLHSAPSAYSIPHQ